MNVFLFCVYRYLQDGTVVKDDELNVIYKWWHKKLADYFDWTSNYDRKVEVIVYNKSFIQFNTKYIKALNLKIILNIILSTHTSRKNAWNSHFNRIKNFKKKHIHLFGGEF